MTIMNRSRICGFAALGAALLVVSAGCVRGPWPTRSARGETITLEAPQGVQVRGELLSLLTPTPSSS
jgi:hypothetical protein